jgi:type IV pilus assembly protein PilQ
MKNILKIIALFFVVCFITSCATTKNKSVHGDKPLIDTKDVKEKAHKEMTRIEEAGPERYDPADIDSVRDDKRETITTEHTRSYEFIPTTDEYAHLRQQINLNLKSVDFRDAMKLLAEIGGVNILVGDEVSGTVTAELNDVPWDIAFKTLLDMKTLGADIDARNGIIRVHTPEKLNAQEEFKSSRSEVLKRKNQSQMDAEPMLAELFRLYYISPEQAKKTLEDLYNTQSTEGTSVMSNIKITVESTTRSIIVRAHQPELDVIDAVLEKIDVKTKQVLIEAFIVEATSDFQKALGTRIGAMTEKNPDADKSTTVSGVTGGGNAATTAAGITLGAAAGTVSNNSITGGTSGIGILKTLSTAALKIEIEALQSLGKTNIISSPSVFTLNNQEAKVTQGTQIAYQSSTDGVTTTEFKEAALALMVTPSIIGDGHVLLDIKVNNDSPVEVAGSNEPGIKTNEITTKLLVGDGDIVVIGGIKIHNASNTGTKTPGLGDVPIVGNLFKGKTQKNKLEEMLIFLSPRVLD